MPSHVLQSVTKNTKQSAGAAVEKKISSSTKGKVGSFLEVEDVDTAATTGGRSLEMDGEKSLPRNALCSFQHQAYTVDEVCAASILTLAINAYLGSLCTFAFLGMGGMGGMGGGMGGMGGGMGGMGGGMGGMGATGGMGHMHEGAHHMPHADGFGS